MAPPQPRNRVARGFARERRHDDFDGHGQEVEQQIANVQQLHRTRPKVLGVDPRLILVFELVGPVDPDGFAAADLAILDYSDLSALVAFPDDVEMAAFRERIAQYRQGVPVEEGRTGAAYEAMMDAIVRVRSYGPEDRVTGRLEVLLQEADPDQTLLVDVECWFPGTSEEAGVWLDELQAAVEEARGELLDRYVNGAAHLALARVQGNKDAIRSLSQLDVIAELDAVPAALTTTAAATDLSADDLPDIPPAAADATLVGLIDSGVQSGHPLLAASVYDAVTLTPGIPDGEDRHGHGTAIASRILVGDLREVLASGVSGPPHCRILSVRVLDDGNHVPRDRVWAREIEDAVRFCAARGARIINLSVGDPDTPHRGPKSTPVAALIDQLVEELGLVVVIPTGNVLPVQYCNLADDLPETYADALARHAATTMIDPAPAALALTVGGLVPNGASDHLQRVPLGRPQWVSPFSRTGPGVEGAIKPELSSSAGTLVYDRANRDILDDQELRCLLAGLGPDRLVATDVGTSYAAPDVTRVAAAISRRYPNLGSELIRALVLQSVGPVSEEMSDYLLSDRPAARRDLLRRLVGFGQARLDQAVASTPHRAVLVAEGQIEPDETHLYEIPIPRSFFQSGGSRKLTVALAYSAPTRVRRLDYLSTRLEFEVVRGVSAEQVIDLFVAYEDDEDEEDQEQDVADGSASLDDTTEGVVDNPLRFSDLSSTQLPLRAGSVSRKLRSRGANQVSHRTFSQRLKEEDGESLILGIKSLNRWSGTGEVHRYALAVALERDEAQAEVYADLEARVHGKLEVPVQIEVEGS